MHRCSISLKGSRLAESSWTLGELHIPHLCLTPSSTMTMQSRLSFRHTARACHATLKRDTAPLVQHCGIPSNTVLTYAHGSRPMNFASLEDEDLPCVRLSRPLSIDVGLPMTCLVVSASLRRLGSLVPRKHHLDIRSCMSSFNGPSFQPGSPPSRAPWLDARTPTRQTKIRGWAGDPLFVFGVAGRPCSLLDR